MGLDHRFAEATAFVGFVLLIQMTRLFPKDIFFFFLVVCISAVSLRGFSTLPLCPSPKTLEQRGATLGVGRAVPSRQRAEHRIVLVLGMARTGPPREKMDECFA